MQLPLAVLYLLLRREQQTAERARQSTDPFSPWHLANGWRSGERRLHRLRIALAGATRQVEIEELGEGPARRFVLQLPERRVMLGGQLRGTELEANIDGHRSRVTVVAHDAVFSLFDAAGVTEFALQSADFGVELDNAGANAFVAPMNGSVVSVLVEPDQRVAKGDALLIMEAMKMEHSIRAPTAGRVTELFYAAGDLVDGGAPLLAFEPEG